MRHETIEKSMNLMIVLIILAVSIGGLVEIIPLMLSSETTEPAENIEPYSPANPCTTGRSSSARAGPGRISLASAAVTATTGNDCISRIRALSCRNRICRATRGLTSAR
jgi:hypothetical protein